MAPPSAAGAPSVLFDTNVILDAVLARQPWDADATRLLDRAARGDTRGFVAAHAVTTVYDIVERARDRATAVTAVADLLQIVDVVEWGRADFQRALSLGLRDDEDAMQAAACLRVGARYLVTRTERDFRGAPVTPRSAAEVLALLGPPPPAATGILENGESEVLLRILLEIRRQRVQPLH